MARARPERRRSSRSTLAWPSGSRPPAPTPIEPTVIGRLRTPAGRERREQRGPGRRAQLHGGRAGRSGVRRDARGAARRRRAAGPAACRGRRGRLPEPTATGLTTTSAVGQARRTPHRRRPRRRSRRARRPRGRTRRAGRCRGRWPRRPRAARRPRPPGRAPRRRGRPRAAATRMSRQVRWWTESSTSTWQRVAANPPRVTVSARSVTGSGLTAVTDSCSASSGTPAPSSAPSSMSPDAPEDASTQTVTGRPAPTAGRPAPRTPRRRTRCRC